MKRREMIRWPTEVPDDWRTVFQAAQQFDLAVQFTWNSRRQAIQAQHMFGLDSTEYYYSLLDYRYDRNQFMIQYKYCIMNELHHLITELLYSNPRLGYNSK